MTLAGLLYRYQARSVMTRPWRGRCPKENLVQSAGATFHTGWLEEALESCLAAAAGQRLAVYKADAGHFLSRRGKESTPFRQNAGALSGGGGGLGWGGGGGGAGGAGWIARPRPKPRTRQRCPDDSRNRARFLAVARK